MCLWLSNLGKKALTNIAIPLVRGNLPGLVSNLTSNAVNKFERKIIGKGGVRAGKQFTLFISNEDMSDIIKMIKSLEDSCVLSDRVTEIVKHEIKSKNLGFLGALLALLIASLMQPVITSVVKSISGRGVGRAGRGYMDKYFLVLLHPLSNIKITRTHSFVVSDLHSETKVFEFESGCYLCAELSSLQLLLG